MDFDRLLTSYDYPLPPERIAQRPAQRRTDSRLLIWKADGSLRDGVIAELPTLLREGDLLVLNDTRVFPARLLGEKLGRSSTDTAVGGARVELLLLEETAPAEWVALARPGRRLPEGVGVRLEGGARVTVGKDLGQGRRQVLFEAGLEVLDYAWKWGHMPLPPYIHRSDEDFDRERYQTVFARRNGSVAAPTAGLHLDEELLEACARRGAEHAFVTLHVGMGTFRPVDAEDLRRGRLHRERVWVPSCTVRALKACRARGGKVVAVGTTVCRALESLPAELEGDWSGSTELFIRPPYRFAWVDVLLTNFHLPRSSLLMLVAAFAGSRWRGAYRHAVEKGYRFYSYGDANWIEAATVREAAERPEGARRAEPGGRAGSTGRPEGSRTPDGEDPR